MQTYDVKKQNGNMILIMMVGTALLGLLLVTSNALQSTQKDTKAVANENSARLINDIVLARAGQAVAATAILCSQVQGSCFWNPNNAAVQPSQFGFSDMQTSGNTLSFVANTCTPMSDVSAASAGATPSPPTAVATTLSNCLNSQSTISLRIVPIAVLQQQKFISGTAISGDDDAYAVLTTVTTNYVSGAQSQTKPFTLSAIVRRPRPFIRIDANAATCKTTCALSDGQKAQDFCFGTEKVVNNLSGSTATTTAASTIQVWNDGPGYLYAFQINRSYTPNPSFTTNVPIAAIPDALIYDSSTDPNMNGSIPGKIGLAPGTSMTIPDNTLPCYDEQVMNPVVTNILADIYGHIHTGISTTLYVGSSTTQSPTNSTPSGMANYSFKTAEPANTLAVQNDGSTVAATKTTTTIVEVHYEGMN